MTKPGVCGLQKNYTNFQIDVMNNIENLAELNSPNPNLYMPSLNMIKIKNLFYSNLGNYVEIYCKYGLIFTCQI